MEVNFLISLLEIAERTQKGRKIAEDTYNLIFFHKVSDLVKKYAIPNRNPGPCTINMDDKLLERAFQAGVDLIVENGVYCISTGRVVEFTRKEVLDALKECPAEIIIGEGKDIRILKKRQIDGREAVNFCPGAHAPFSEDLGPLVMKDLSGISRADFVEGNNFSEVDGREIMGIAMEVYASRRQVSTMREAARKAGRPGLSVALYPISTRAGVLISVLDPIAGLRPSDSVLTSVLPDLKIEHDLLTANIAFEDYGLWRSSSSFSLMGGFCGGIDGAIVEGVAKPLVAMLCYHAYVNCVGVEKVGGGGPPTITLQPLNWAQSVVSQALNRYSNILAMEIILTASGPGTDIKLLEVAFHTIEATVDGCSLHCPRHGKPRMNAGLTPLEGNFMIEVSDAVITAGMDRKKGDEVLARLMPKIESRRPEPGMSIQECYDLVHDRPSPEYEKIYLQVKEQLAAMGLSFH
jgi:methylamine---corrinoid protein Co-methyltransferase